jgi:hypothetical protein
MLHPSDVAIEYIWEKFGERYFSKETKSLNERWQKVRRSLNHRVFNEGTADHKKFLEGVSRELKALGGMLDLSKELHAIETRINA